MVIATICNHKGGTGKTTSALGLAAALGLSGRRVLLVDLDPQAFLSRALGAKEPAVEHSSLAFFDEDARPERLRPQPMSGFDLLPAHRRLTRRMRRLNKPTDVFWVKEAVEHGDLTRHDAAAKEPGSEEPSGKEAAAEARAAAGGDGSKPDSPPAPGPAAAGGYDVVLFDTAAAVTVYSLNALVASSRALIPVTPEYQPVVGAKQTYQTVQMVQNRLNPDLAAPCFLLTQVDGRKKTHARYQRHLRERYADRVLESVIRTSSALTRTPEDGTTVFDYAPHARGAHDYANAADEWMGRIEREAGAAEAVEAEAPKAPEKRAA